MRIPHVMGLTATVVTVGLLAVSAGCGTDDTGEKPVSCPATAQPGLAIAIGARANSPEPVIPKEAADYLTSISEGQGYTIVRVDGAPTIVCGRRFASSAANGEGLRDDQRKFARRAVAEIKATRAREPETDTLAALTMAAGFAGQGGFVILADSGLQTTTPLDFRTEGLLFSPPQDIVKRLRAADLLPDLRDRTVMLSGIGWAAKPQEQPNEAVRRRLIAIWTAIAEAGGGRVQVIAQGNTGTAVTDEPKVSTVSLPPADPVPASCDAEIVLPDDGAVGFQPDSPILRTPERAKATLLTVADFLQQHPATTVTVTGSIAHYGADVPDAGLAMERARAVAAALGDLGVSAGRITPHGEGWGPYPGTGDEVDQKNRRVVLRTFC